MYLKRLLALLCSLALVFCLLPSTAFAEGGNGNIDGGGGSMGQGTSSNFWNPGNDGVRITVVDADSGNAISSPIDFTNRSQNNVVHFGKVNKLQYLAGTALTPQSGAGYDYTRPIQSMPTIVSSKGQSNIEAIKRYFCSEYACQMVAQAAGVDYERMIAGDYKLLIEPIAYFTHNGQYYCMTATEAALYDQKSGGALRKTMTSLTHKNLPLSMFLEFSDLGLPAWTGSTTSKQSNADIISSLGVGIVWFDERPPEGEIEAPDVEYRVDTDVITSVTDQPDGDATLEGSDPPLEFMETEASDEAAPEDDGTASGAPSDSDEPAGSAAGEEETPSNLSAEGADDTPAETVSETAGEPAPPKPKRAPRRKKAAPVEAPVHGENEDSAEAPAAEEQAVESSASVENTAPPDEGETPISEDTAPQEEAPVDTASALRRTAVTHRSDTSILTIRSREEVETQEDREDVIWHEIHNAYRTRRILTGQLGGIEQLDNRKTVAVVDYKGFRIIIPIKEMMINLGRSPSGQEYADLMLRQNKILGNMLGADIDFVVRGIDSKTRSVVASRREAMMRKRQTFYFDLDAEGKYRIYEGRIVQARVIAVAEKVIRVEVFGVETSILARDLAWDWIGDAHERFSVGDEVLVRILNVRRNSLEDLGIRADIKSTSENTDRDNLQKCRIQGKYAGKVTDVHKGVVYVRLANGVNAVAHSCYDYRMPGKKDDVSFAVTHLDVERGIALGIITRIIRQNL